MLLTTCDRMGKVLAIVCSKHFRKAFDPLRKLRNRKYGNIADGVMHHMIHEGIAAFAQDITTLRKTSGPRGKSGQPLDTPERAAGALKAYMEDTAARLERGTHIHDSTTTSPHLHFFRAIAPTIIGYDDQPGGNSGNRHGLKARDTGTQRQTRHAQTPSKEKEETGKDGNARPCLWHVVSLSPLRTRKGGQFTCMNPTCKLSHATKSLDEIVPAPTKADLRRWDASGALKVSLTEVARQLDSEWI